MPYGWRAARRHCITASRGAGFLRARPFSSSPMRTGSSAPQTSSGREALMACGAVLDHFRVAMAAAGCTANVERFPNPNNRLHVASVDFTPMEYVTDGHRQRANAILQRRTDRLPFATPPDWDSFESALRDTVTSDAVRLDTIADDLRPQLAEASQLTESLRLYDSSYHAELEWWTGSFRGL